MPENNFVKEKRSGALWQPPQMADPLGDALLWANFRNGSDAAFIRIYETYFEKLYAYGIRVSGSHSMVKDCVQEVFLDLKGLRSKLGETDNIKFYLFKCLKRKLHKEASKWQHKREDMGTKVDFDFTISHEQFLIDQQIGQEKADQLNAAIQLLSPRKKEIIYYFFYEGLDYGQIKEIMGLENLKTTRNLMYKALNFLREVLG